MKALKKLIPLLLLALAWTGCRDRSSRLADFNHPVYTPEYASGFDIKGVDDRKSVLLTVTNPWRDMSVKRRYGESGYFVRYLYGTLQRSGEIAKSLQNIS